MHETLAIQIERLRSMKTKALAARYRELFGKDARSANHAYLLRRIAWRLQARAEGELERGAHGAGRRSWRTMPICGCERPRASGANSRILQSIGVEIHACRPPVRFSSVSTEGRWCV